MPLSHTPSSSPGFPGVTPSRASRSPQSFFNGVSGVASGVSPDLIFALGARTQALSTLVGPIQQLRFAQVVAELPSAESLGTVLPSVQAREDFSLPGESVSLNLLDRLVWQFRGRVPVDDHLGSVCASLVMSSGNLHDMTAYQLIQVQEVLGAAAQPRTALVESATEKLRLAYLDKIKSNSLTFAWAPLAWRQDFDITLSAVKHHGNLLQYAPVDLKDNAVVVTAAVKNAAEAIQYASARLQDHEGIASLAVSGFGPTLFYLSARLKDTPAVVRLAIQENGMALQHASDRLRRDPQLIRLAIAQNPRAARFVL